MAIVDQENWSEESTQVGISVTFPLFGIPVDVNNSYDNFKKARERIFKSTKFDYEYINHLQVMKTALSKEAYSSFNECVKSVCGNDNERSGIHVYISQIFKDDEIEITIKYNKIPGSNEGRIFLTNDPALAQNLVIVNPKRFPKFITDGVKVPIVYKRVKRSEDSHIQFAYTTPDGTPAITPSVVIKALHRYAVISKNETDSFSSTMYIKAWRGLVLNSSNARNLESPYKEKCTQWCPNNFTWEEEDSSEHQTIQYGVWSNPNCGIGMCKGWYISNIGSCCCGEASHVGRGTGDQCLQTVLLIVNNDDGKYDPIKLSLKDIKAQLNLKLIKAKFP